MNKKRDTVAALITILLLAACTTTPAGTDATACATYAEVHNTYLAWLDTNNLTSTSQKRLEQFAELLDKVHTARKTAETQEIRDAMIGAEQALQAVNEPRFFLTSQTVAEACENAGAPITLDK